MWFSPGRLVAFARYASLTAAGLMLQGCATLNNFDYARDVGSVQPTRWAQVKGNVAISWRLGSPEWVRLMCQPMGQQGSPAHGCAMLDDEGENCVIFAVEPDDFQDRQRLAVLGHEAWHCFGAKHAEPNVVAQVANAPARELQGDSGKARPPVRGDSRHPVADAAMAVVAEGFALTRRGRIDPLRIERRQYEPVTGLQLEDAGELQKISMNEGLEE
jgi:hypothetical protein